MKDYKQHFIFIEDGQDLAIREVEDVKEIIIPKTFDQKAITVIGSWAFSGNTKLESLTIPEGIKTIRNSAFAGCYKLKSIVIPESVESIESTAFAGCPDLTIYCKANTENNNWSTLWNTWNCPVYFYSETKPKNSGNFWHYDNGAIIKW